MLKFKALLLLLLSFCFLFADDSPLVPFKTAFDYFSTAEPDIPSTSRFYEPTSDQVAPATFNFYNPDNGFAYYDVGAAIYKLSNVKKYIIYTNNVDKDVPRFSFLNGGFFYSYEYSLPVVYTFRNGADYYTLDKGKIPGGIYFDTFKSAVYKRYEIISNLKSCPEGSNFNASTEQCQVCLNGEIWDKSQNKCITGCPVGSVYNPEKKTCDEIICAAPEFLDKVTNTCKPCGKNEKYDAETKSCICQSGFFSFENLCVSSCVDFEVLQQRFNCICSNAKFDKRIKLTFSSGEVAGKFEGFYDKNETIIGVNRYPDTIVSNYACVAKCSVGIIRVENSKGGNALCSGIDLDKFSEVNLDTLDNSFVDPNSVKTDKEKEEDKNKDKDKDKGGGSGKGDGKGDGSTTGDDNSKGSSGNITIGDNNKTKNPDKPGSDHSKDDPNNNGKGKDDGSKGDKGHSGSGNNNDGVGKGDFEAGIGDSDNEDHFATLEGEFKAFDGLIGDLKGFKNMLSNGTSIPKLSKSSIPKSCPVTRKFSGTNIESKDVTWDLCAILAPMRDPLYFMFYLAFLFGFMAAAYKILLVAFRW